MVIGGSHKTDGSGFNAEILQDDLTWIPVNGFKQFPTIYEAFSFAHHIDHERREDPKAGIYMFGGRGLSQSEWQFNNQFSYGAFNKTFYYNGLDETVVEVEAAPAPIMRTEDQILNSHFGYQRDADALGGKGMIVHSHIAQCK